jgi:hypothetical protein
MSETGNIPIAEDLRDRYDAVCSVCSRVPPYAWERDLWEKELIERCSRAEAEVAQLKAENLRLKAPVSDEEWEEFVGLYREYDGDTEVQINYELATFSEVNALLTARTQGGS